MATAPATCPSCGAIVPPKIALSRTGRRIFDAVKAHPGILAENLRDIVWADDPSGGPESRHAIYAHVFILNKRLAAHGLAVRAERGGPAGYRIVCV
jgi:hypothetical protein